MLRIFKPFRAKAKPGAKPAASTLLPSLLDQVRQSGPIRSPLVLISQISRSGGTLLSQLFDHHPQVWAHPFELKIGYPNKWDWPDLSALRDSEAAWKILRYEKADERFGAGFYFKGNEEKRPMLFGVDMQEAIFRQTAADITPQTNRDWIDVYFTSFFGAWLDYQRRYGEKRYVTGFASMLSLERESMS